MVGCVGRGGVFRGLFDSLDGGGFLCMSWIM